MRLVEQMKFAMTWDKMEENRTKVKIEQYTINATFHPGL